MAEDIGESLVGAYLRYVERYQFVLFNTFLPPGEQVPVEQGEIDVIGIRLGDPRHVYFAEVTTHIEGMTYGGNKPTIQRVHKKLTKAHAFAEKHFPNDVHHFAVWSPRVPVGAMTKAFKEMASDFKNGGKELDFIINEEYGNRIQALVDVARNNSRATSDPAFRLLQVLTRIKTKQGQKQGHLTL
jgi:hypothetical protein